MKLLNYIQVWIVTFFLVMCTCAPLSGQPELSQEFLFKAYKSVKNIERFLSVQDTIFKTYLINTFKYFLIFFFYFIFIFYIKNNFS